MLYECRALKSYAAWWADEYAAENPLSRLRFPRALRSAPQPIASDDAVNAVLRSLGGANGLLKLDHARQRIRTTIVLVRDTGARRSVITSLRLDDIDLEHGRVTFRLTESRISRVVPLSRDAQRELRWCVRVRATHRHAASTALFLGRDGALTSNGLGQSVERAGRDPGTPLSCHQLRRRFSLVWAQRGGSDDSLQLLAGWADSRMPARYRSALVQQLAEQQFASIVDGR